MARHRSQQPQPTIRAQHNRPHKLSNMSRSARGEREKNDNEEDNFVWQDYLDMTNTVEVPHILFPHVEQSLLNGLKEGMMMEVPNKGDENVFWIATITMACGPLLRLRYIGQEENRSNDFWCDLTKVQVHPLGWCKSQTLELKPPLEIQKKLTDSQTLVERVMQQGKSVPPELLTGDGFTPVDRIKQGMKVEVQDKTDPHNLWFATIIENVGGRLLLRHDTPDSSSPDFWLFYNSPRLFRFGWTQEQGPPWTLKWPRTNHSFEEWQAVIEMAKEDAQRIPLPPDLFQNNPSKLEHRFELGMKLEAIHPHNMAEICPATVVKVFSAKYFLVKIDSYNSTEDNIECTWLCSAEHPYIFPAGWAQSHGLQLTHPCGWTTSKEEFDWIEYLENTNSIKAPNSRFFQRASALDSGLEAGMKLEAVNPENEHQICAASIVKIIDNLLWIHLDSHDSFHPNHILSFDSVNIFPVGWCESNSYPLQTPCQYQPQAKQEAKIECSKKETTLSSPSSSQQRSFWCPKIYFNHKCFSGPFLSKGKLAQLPKAVGPGPVTLVMREVLAMLISVAYKSSRVLKELQSDGKPELGMHLEVLKAKYKTNTYRASVAVVTSADQVPSFCKDICMRLQVCPYMFGPVSVGENNCPENCNTLSKTRFTQYWVQGKRKIGRPKGEASNMIPRPKKKRGRKKIHESPKPLENESNEDDGRMDLCSENLIDSPEEAQDIPEDENDSQSNHTNESERNISSFESARRPYRKKEFPKSAIKTRGAKLPNFALQIRASHWPHKRLSVSSNESLSKSDKYQEASLTCTESSEHHNNEGNPHDEDPVEVKTQPLDVADQTKSATNHKIGPAPVMELHSNPLYWSEDDVYQYLMNTDDCAWIAQKCKDEMIDGQAFMMLNFPTLKEHLLLKTALALKLCHHIEQLKLAYYLQYVVDNEP